MGSESLSFASDLHKRVPPDWYHASMKRNLFQRFWHNKRFEVVGGVLEPVDGRVLDVGCADGMFTRVILEKTGAAEVIGIDVLKSSVDWASKHWRKQKRMKFRLGNAHKLKYKSDSFSAVTAFEVMEHVGDPGVVVGEIKRVLKRGGYVVILVPTDNLLFRLIWWFVTNFWWARIWQDCHIQSFDSRNTLGKFLSKSGFKVEVDKKFLLGMLNVVKARKK